MCETERSGGFGAGVLMGAVVGLAIGVLYAPRAGKETRAMLREKGEEAKDRAEEIIEVARERAKKIVDDARGKVAELQEKETE